MIHILLMALAIIALAIVTVVIAVGLPVAILVIYIKNKMAKNTSPPPLPNGTASPTAPAQENGPKTDKKEKKGGSWWSWYWFLVVIGAVIFCVGMQKSNEQLRLEVKQAAQTKAKETWSFSWRRSQGHFGPAGERRDGLRVEITSENSKQLLAVIHDDDNGMDVVVGGLTLNKIGDDLIGTWENYRDGDGGSCSLYWKTDGMWSGPEELKSGEQIDCTLTRKIAR